MSEFFKNEEGKDIVITNTPEIYFGDCDNSSLYLAVFELGLKTINSIYDLVNPSYPKTVKPGVYIGDYYKSNAYAENDKIIVLTGLIDRIQSLIGEKYSDDRIRQYSLLASMEPQMIRESIFQYVWKFCVLHELYHIWHNHNGWDSKYKYDHFGNLIRREVSHEQRNYKQEYMMFVNHLSSTAEQRQASLTQQAQELDADSSAICMMFNMMMHEADKNISIIPKEDRNNDIKNQTILMVGALSTIFCALDGDLGAQFEKLQPSLLELSSHPLPAIRLVYAEEILVGMLFHFISEEQLMVEIQSDWFKMTIDMEDDNGKSIDWRNSFYSSAYTEKAQIHLCSIKNRMVDMYDSLAEIATGNLGQRLSEEDISISKYEILFTEDGQSLHGWQ